MYATVFKNADATRKAWKVRHSHHAVSLGKGTHGVEKVKHHVDPRTGKERATSMGRVGGEYGSREDAESAAEKLNKRTKKLDRSDLEVVLGV